MLAEAYHKKSPQQADEVFGFITEAGELIP
jgi:hypothetical protein